MTKPTRLTLILAVVVAAVAGTAVRAQGAVMEIRVANLETVFEKYIKKIESEAALKEQAERFNLERQELILEGQKLNEEYNALREQAQDAALSEEKREEMRASGEEMLSRLKEFQQRLKSFDEEKRRILDEQSKRMRRTLVREIRESVKDFCDEEGIDLVVDISGETLNMEPVILYSADRLDITERIVERLNLPDGVRR